MSDGESTSESSLFQRLNIEVRDLSLHVEALEICLATTLDFLALQYPDADKLLKDKIEAAFAAHLKTRAEEEGAVLRVALDSIMKRLSR